MKKNRMMRLASVLLIMTLLSTSVISGTFAKYVTTAEGSESARVAKWGVQVGVQGFSDTDNGLFMNAYAADDETEITNTVAASDKVVAPGTKSENGIKFTLTGTPEVAVKVEIVVTDANGNAPVDVMLPAGTYTDWTESVNGEYTNKFTTTEDYHPIKFTLVDDGNTGAPIVKAGTLADVEKALEDMSKEYAPGQNLAHVLKDNYSGNYTLTWAWDYDDSGKGTYDKQDTLLGNIAAGIEKSVTNASTEIDLKVSITVTQID